MAIDDKIRDKKLQYKINREAAKISLLSGKRKMYVYLTGEKIKSRIVEHILHIHLLVKHLKNKQK